MRDESRPAFAVSCLKEEGERSVWLVQREGAKQRMIVKRWRRGWWEIVKDCFRVSQAWRQVRGAQLLKKAGVRTPTIVEDRVRRAGNFFSGWNEVEYAYVEGVNGLEFLQHIKDADKQRESAAAIGDLVGRMVRAGVFNRDMKLANVIVEGGHSEQRTANSEHGARAGDESNVGDSPTPLPPPSEGGGRRPRLFQERIVVIDPVGVRRMRRGSTTAAARMLERLLVQPLRFGLAIERGVVMTCVRAMARAAEFDRQQRRDVVARLRSLRSR